MAFIDAAKIPATGHPRIDAGHQRMAEEVNRLYELWQGGASQERVLRSFAELLRVVGRHFAEEEEIGRIAGYEGVEQHAARHRDLLEELTDLLDRVRSVGGYGDLTIDAFALIDTLLYEHEIVDDQDFWLLFRNGVPERPEVEPQLIVWDHRLATGIAVIDDDHKVLVELLNRLSSALGEKAPGSTVGRLLERVMEHTTQHFAREEEMMAEAGSPGLENHRILHETLVNDLKSVMARQAEGQYVDLEDLLQTYMKFWLIDHIRNVDARTLPGANAEAVVAQGMDAE
jgi:hemerythrin